LLIAEVPGSAIRSLGREQRARLVRRRYGSADMPDVAELTARLLAGDDKRQRANTTDRVDIGAARSAPR
jgi:hypothetical protein